MFKERLSRGICVRFRGGLYSLLHNFDEISKLIAGKRPCLYTFFLRLFQLRSLSWETGQAEHELGDRQERVLAIKCCRAQLRK